MHLSVSMVMNMKDTLVTSCDLDYVYLSLAKVFTAAYLLPTLSMLVCATVRIHHASLGVDQGENTSLFLPPPAPLALI